MLVLSHVHANVSVLIIEILEEQHNHTSDLSATPIRYGVGRQAFSH